MSVDDILEVVQSHADANHVVLTGGESLVHDESVILLESLADLGCHTTVETNGTIDRDVPYEHTGSCYRDEAPACGPCDACAFHLQAFQNLGERDPIEYAECPDYTDS